MDETLEPAWQGIKGGNMRLWVIDGQMSRVQGVCIKTGELWSVKVKTSELLPYLRGIKDGTNRPLIQDAFPTMNAAGREFLISGISPTGWDLIYNYISTIGEQTDEQSPEAEGEGGGEGIREDPERDGL